MNEDIQQNDTVQADEIVPKPKVSFFGNEINFCRQFISGTYLSNFLQNTLKSNQAEINSETRTIRNLTKLKEPRELFALPKELDCPQQPARWPTECQVMENRVQHIDYTPSVPEYFYQPTGREVQPKPVGEEAGAVIFQYHPMSAVNYFSRSSVGGSRYFLPAIPPDRDGEDELRFESRFESGNLAKVVKVTDTYYELYLRTDLYTNRHMQWFYFKVNNTKTNVTYRFSLVNLSKGDSLYSTGMKPLMYSTKDAELNSIGWRRFGENIAYYRNDNGNGDEDQAPNYTLSFNLEFPHDCDEVYIAHCYPYTYSDLQDYLNDLQNHPIKSAFTKLRLLCRTLAGNNVYYLTITAPSVGEEPKRKKAVVVTARVHPGETPASWMMKGFIDYLTGESEQAKELREKFIFKLVPMLNPDGVIVGNNRCSLTGRDLNRQYRTVIRETYPPVWHTKLMVRREGQSYTICGWLSLQPLQQGAMTHLVHVYSEGTVAGKKGSYYPSRILLNIEHILIEECGIVMYCDLHAHSRKHNVFIYGCENKRYVERRLQEQVFPLMLHKNAADKFSFENCKFRIQRSKEGTGRVVVWMMGVANSYTMEASFAGSSLGSRVDTHFNAQDFESMGKAFCETLLDFCDEEPSKEKLRMKIVERLTKEGSSADEPTNISLSDYSSDEGDTSSSSGDELRGVRNDGKNWGKVDEAFSLTVPPPTPLLPKRESKVKVKDGTSPKKRQLPQIDRSPPAPREPLPVHRTTLDPPCPAEEQDSSDAESADESTSGPRPGRRGRVGGRTRRGRGRHMPPELIVTAAQQSSPETKHRNSMMSNNEKVRSQSWHSSKSRPQIRNTGGTLCKQVADDALSDGNIRLGPALRRKVWTGCACNAVHCDTALSKDSTLRKALWSKGPLTWAASLVASNSEALLKSCSQKLAALQKIGGYQTGDDERSTIALKKRKSWIKKRSVKGSKTDDEPCTKANWPELVKKTPKKKNKGGKQSGRSNSTDPTGQGTQPRGADSRRSSKQFKDTPEADNSTKMALKKSEESHMKFKAGGVAVAAGDNDQTESGSESESRGKTVKKKKKRKTRILKKPKSSKLVPTSRPSSK